MGALQENGAYTTNDLAVASRDLSPSRGNARRAASDLLMHLVKGTNNMGVFVKTWYQNCVNTSWLVKILYIGQYKANFTRFARKILNKFVGIRTLGASRLAICYRFAAGSYPRIPRFSRTTRRVWHVLNLDGLQVLNALIILLLVLFPIYFTNTKWMKCRNYYAFILLIVMGSKQYN